VTTENETRPQSICAIAEGILDYLDSVQATNLEKAGALSTAKTAIEEAANAQYGAVIRANIYNQTKGKR
jgi:hypothetical protein